MSRATLCVSQALSWRVACGRSWPHYWHSATAISRMDAALPRNQRPLDSSSLPSARDPRKDRLHLPGFFGRRFSWKNGHLQVFRMSQLGRCCNGPGREAPCRAASRPVVQECGRTSLKCLRRLRSRPWLRRETETTPCPGIVAELAVEALQRAVLPPLAGIDQGGLDALIDDSFWQRPRDELRAIAGAEVERGTAFAGSRYSIPDRDVMRFKIPAEWPMSAGYITGYT